MDEAVLPIFIGFSKLSHSRYQEAVSHTRLDIN